MSENELRSHRGRQESPPCLRQPWFQRSEHRRNLQEPGALFAVSLMLILSVVFIWIGL